jgi:predicted DNA-binding ArsR family transcriptional regulator
MNNLEDEKRNCKKHGYTIFKLKKSKNRTWFSCYQCLKQQWKTSQEKQRKKIGQKEYHQKYSKENYKIRKSLSVYLTMILYAANIKPK